jgi:multidrug efflux pump subunit AcrB
VVSEGFLGAALVGLMVLVFLRDWRSALVVVLNIPLALMASVLALWVTGQTVNLMTLGGLALAIGILVDEATVEIENIHSQLKRGLTTPQAVLEGGSRTAVPRLLAMLCILAVFVSSFFMQGAARALFVPLSLAVGFAMIASYILSSTFVPVMCVWLLKHSSSPTEVNAARSLGRVQRGYEQLVARSIRLRSALVAAYFASAFVIVLLVGSRLGREVFPAVDAGQFRLRMRAPDGTHIARTEQLAKNALRQVELEFGDASVELSLGYVGMIHSNFPVNAVYQWSRGPEEAILYVDLDDDLGIADAELKERLRRRLAKEMPDVRFSFEPSDIVNEVMSFGSPTPVEISVSGPNFADNRAYADKVRAELQHIPFLRDLQIGQSLDYPTIEVTVDREKAGLAGLMPSDVSRALVAATSSSRFIVPNYWADPKSGIAYQVQVEIPRPILRTPDNVNTVDSAADLGQIPLKRTENGQVRVGDVASLREGTMPGQYDRYNMRRQVTLTANITGADLGSVSKEVADAVKRAGDPPVGVQIETRGQIPPMREMQSGLTIGLGLAVVAVFLLLTANFQSLKLALAAVSTVPAVIAGVVLMLWVTGTTLNIQSFIGAIMAIGVAMANAILLVTFAEQRRRAGAAATEAAAAGASDRLRAILMTSCAMIAGMIPMAIGLGEAGQQYAPLGRAVIGGLLAATAATLLALPCIFAILQRNAITSSPSLDPHDVNSRFFHPPSATA